MQKQNLDVLSDIPSIDLCDFWSKIILPLWSLVNVLFDVNRAEVNNPKSKVAYLMGSFFLIHKTIFEKIGTFQSVRNTIQENRALGVRIKEAGYNMRIVRLDGMMSARWSRDIRTLWHGIGRTLAPIAIKNKFKVIKNLLIIIFFVYFAIYASSLHFISYYPAIYLYVYATKFPQFDFRLVLFLNVVYCMMPNYWSINQSYQTTQADAHVRYVYLLWCKFCSSCLSL
jgi:hypothetical protein